MKHGLMKSVVMWCCLMSSAFAIDLELTQGVSRALPVGIDSFGSEQQAMEFTDVLRSDLSMTGQFKLISSGHAVSELATLDDWQRLGADSVVQGRLVSLGAGRYSVQVKLLDTAMKGRVLFAKEYQSVTTSGMRRLAHYVSDAIYYQLTGDRGIFSTRIASILVRRDAHRTHYSLEVSDADGSNPQSLLISADPIMSPAWSPNGREIAYVSFEKKRAQIYTVAVETGQRRLVTDFPGINGAPAWSPDGQQLAVVLSKGNNPKIYLVSLSNGTMKQVTFGESIDTEPRFSPDGASLLFTSGRGGAPQVYKLNLASGAISRVTYVGNYNAKAAYTPNQQQVVMLHRADKGFNIGVMQVGRTEITPLTNSPADESPSIAPNGRFVVYATRVNDKGVLGLVSIDGRVHKMFPARDGDLQEPAWSPFL